MVRLPLKRQEPLRRETNYVILIICILWICLSASLLERTYLRANLEGAVFRELMWTRGVEKNYQLGDSKLLRHTLMLECVFILPERWGGHQKSTFLCSERSSFQLPSHPPPSPRQFARIQLHFSILSCQPEPFSPNAADLLTYKNTSRLPLGLETSVPRLGLLCYDP